MTAAEVDIFDPQPRALVPVPDSHGDIDSWVQVASKVIKLADYICETQFVPKAYRGNAPATAAAILAGRELGLPPMTALRHVQVVEGSPSLSAEYKRARVLAAGHDFDILELTTTRCRVSGRRKGSGKPPLEITFSMDDARRAHLVKPRGAWETRPRRMLFARASTELCDFMFADITNGLPTTELLEGGGEGEDGFAGYAEAPQQDSPKPAQRTARRQRPAAVGAGPPLHPVPAPGSPAPAGMPPLPGEDEEPPSAETTSDQVTEHEPPATESDETDHDTPGTATRGKGGQLTAIWTALSTDFAFTSEEKPQARAVCEHIIDHQLADGTTGSLSFNEARIVLDTLANWREVAERNQMTPREFLIELMATAEKQGGGDE